MNENAKAIEKASLYRDMINSWAWKDFLDMVDERRQSALEKALLASSIEEVQILRGMVKAIDGIKSDVAYILEGAN